MSLHKARKGFESIDMLGVFCVSHEEREMKMIAKGNKKLVPLSLIKFVLSFM